MPPTDQLSDIETPATPGSFAVPDVASLAAEVASLKINVEQLHARTMDHEKRFDTLQTPWWKRVWFWVDGWPWHDLNGVQRPRPWHRGR